MSGRVINHIARSMAAQFDDAARTKLLKAVEGDYESEVFNGTRVCSEGRITFWTVSGSGPSTPWVPSCSYSYCAVLCYGMEFGGTAASGSVFGQTKAVPVSAGASAVNLNGVESGSAWTLSGTFINFTQGE